MSGYWVVRGSAVKDQGAAERYADMWAPIADSYGAEVVAGKGQIDTREGEDYPRQLVIRFSSYADAVACYEDPDYKAAIEVANKAFDRDLVILEGMD